MIALLQYFEFELVALALWLAVALWVREAPIAAMRPGLARLASWASRPALALCAPALLALLLSATISALRPPIPTVHDEFAHLLAADTFASGRLANPTPPHWAHFETIHVIQQPSYSAKYPPGPGLLLASGQVFFGSPLVGVWLGTAAAAAALTWMLWGWVTPPWALVGGLVFALHPNLELGWGQSYWGGTPSVLGSALLFGGLGRVLRRRGGSGPWGVAAGAAVLAITRPFEGLLACLTVGGFALARLGPAEALRRIAPALAALLIPLGLAMALYHARVTGDPWRTPYQVHEETYGVAPLFVWQAPRTPLPFRNRELARFHQVWSMEAWRAQRSVGGLLSYKSQRLFQAWLYLLGPLLTVPLLAAGCRGRTTRFACAALALQGLGALCVTWLQPHYLAVAIPLLLLLAVQGWRRIHARPGNGPLLSALLLLGIALVFCNAAFHYVAQPQRGWGAERARVAEQLADIPGRHLVFVRYGPDPDPLEEWVYNAADLEAAAIVWARDLGAESNRRLRQHFSERSAWQVEPNAAVPRPRRLAPLGVR